MPHATEFTPQEYPPFPTSPEFKTVNLQTISLKKLLSEDATEQDRVFEACKTRGFFYLELGGCESGETILKGADDICRMAEDVFKLPMEVKEEQRMREGQLDG
jgi:isopenicillin N synthase-like dioxygenase